MKPIHTGVMKALLLITLGLMTMPAATAQEPAAGAPQGPKVASVEISPGASEAEVGQKKKFTVTAKDETGKAVEIKSPYWVALPPDSALADESGMVTFFQPGEIKVVAVVNGKPGFAKVNVKAAKLSQIEIEPATGPVMVGGTVKLTATPRGSNGDPRNDVAVAWVSETPSIATVDAAGFITGVAPGKATIRASAEGSFNTVSVQVVSNNVRTLSVDPGTSTARTGDVIRFHAQGKDSQGAQVNNPSVRWSVSGDGAFIDPDGGFVAERAGSYVVSATSGEHTAVATVVVTPRNVERELKLVGRAPITDQVAEQWIFGNYAYVSTISDKLLVYDISDPAKPKLTETLKVDAHIINDVSVSADGKIGVITREGASSRKNGIMFLDTTDPAHPKVLSEYTETVTGGVHSAYIDGHYVYLTDDATGSIRVIDFADVKAPKEVARWQVENPLVETGGIQGGRYLHDVQVKDGLAYLAYWRDGLVILDVGNGVKGGSPEKPQFVSQLRLNYYELYGNGWLSGAHAVFRYKNYVFVGDEVFPEIFDIAGKKRIP
ncbi:MAG TPA: Ig-like domain-containing protein, partial [Pyrinomonadaceae bacterium]|nr:Ig-like domain-containing protein [Pyrinomonadaceae bacterium]